MVFGKSGELQVRREDLWIYGDVPSAPPIAHCHRVDSACPSDASYVTIQLCGNTCCGIRRCQAYSGLQRNGEVIAYEYVQ